MTWKHWLRLVASAMLIAVLADARASGQGASKSEVEKLRKEVAQLRADLEAAMREIRNLKELLAGKGTPEKGPLYAGQPARYWVNQLADASPRLRIEALEAIGALAQKDRELVPVLLKTLLEESDSKVGSQAVKSLAAAGPRVVPALIDIVKDPAQEYPKYGRRRALDVFDLLRAQAAPAVPALVSLLREKDPQPGTYYSTIRTLMLIGPDAKEAIPALVDALDRYLRKKGGYFGLKDSSPNVTVLTAIVVIEPKLRDVLPSEERLGVRIGSFGGTSIRPPSQEQLEIAWREAHAALVKATRK